MSRPASITLDQILLAAREVFLEKGIRATTAEVARRAGVAEGSVFKRFKTKDLLFIAAMEPHLDDLPWIKILAQRTDEVSVRDALYDAGIEAISFFRTLMPLVMMTWSNQTSEGMPARLSRPNAPPLRALKSIAGFFERAIRAGQLRRHDPEILARVFIASMQNYVFLDMVIKEQEQPPLPESMYVRSVVHLILVGAEPPFPTSKARPTAKPARASARASRKKK